MTAVIFIYRCLSAMAYNYAYTNQACFIFICLFFNSFPLIQGFASHSPCHVSVVQSRGLGSSILWSIPFIINTSPNDGQIKVYYNIKSWFKGFFFFFSVKTSLLPHFVQDKLLFFLPHVKFQDWGERKTPKQLMKWLLKAKLTRKKRFFHDAQILQL